MGRVVGRMKLAKSVAGCVATAALVLAAGAPGAPGVLGDGDLMTMSPDGTNLKPLVWGPGGAWGAAWSRDGSRVAFVIDGDIYVVNADRTGVARITDGPVWDFAPAWSPDGTKIAFSRETTNNAPADVYVMNADGSAQTNLTNNIAFDSHPAWAPDGTRIAFVSNREDLRTYGLYVMSPDGSGQRPFGATPLHGFDPDWSPDGTRLAYSKDLGPPVWNREIAVVDAGGSNEHVIASDPRSINSSPSWSPDGTKIVFGRGWKLAVVNADGTGLHDLAVGQLYQSGPAWSPEGDEIAFDTGSPTANVPPPPPPPGIPPPPPRPPPPPPPPPPPAPPRARCVVPRVLGMTTRRARSRIRARHCSVGRIRRAHSRRVGRVVRQTPRPGARKRRSYPVKLVVGRR